MIFFFKQKTAYEMRISDWSSDVCSSDLPPGGDLRVIPRSQHFRDRAPFPQGGAGVLRVFKKASLKAFLLTARSRAHYAGNEPDASVQYDLGRHFPDRKSVV